MKIMGKVIDKMMEENDKNSYDEMMPELTIKVSKDGTATVTRNEEDADEEVEEEVEEEAQDSSPEYVDEKE